MPIIGIFDVIKATDFCKDCFTATSDSFLALASAIFPAVISAAF